MNIAAYIDHTLLKPSATRQDIERLCREATQYQFAAVCVPPYYVNVARYLVSGHKVKIATVIGFPFGYSVISAKTEEIESAIADGADELDMVINLAALKSNDWSYLEKEIGAVMPIITEKNKSLKVIIESGILDDGEIIRCCKLYSRYRVQFLKTSTGYAERGATVEAVKLMRQHVPPSMGIKASGGIRTFEFARTLIEAGATRIGCSAGVQIVEQSSEVIS